MRMYEVLISGLTLGGKVREIGDLVPTHLVDDRTNDQIMLEAPALGDTYLDKLRVVEQDDPDVDGLELLAEVVEVEGLTLEVETLPHPTIENRESTPEIDNRESKPTRKPSRSTCGYVLADGRLCGQTSKPGERCRHHKDL